jgi:hypothetical protein
MAGVIETRGKIKHVKNALRRSPQLVLQVQSRHITVVERLCALTGVRSRITESKTIEAGDRRGCIEHCPEPHVHMAAEMPRMAVWAITGVGASIVLHNLAPYMDPDLDLSVIEEIIAAAPMEGRGAAAVADTTLRLVRLGWTLPDSLAVTSLARWAPGLIAGTRRQLPAGSHMPPATS